MKKMKHMILSLAALVTTIIVSTAMPALAKANKDVPSVSDMGTTAGKGYSVAHMGYTGKAPGNTAAAFREAGKAGFWGAEADIRATSDGVLICLHDESVSGMTNGSGYAYSKKWSTIKKYKINAGTNWRKYGTQHICTLSEYLDICKEYNMVAVLDIKWSSEKAVRNMYKEVKKKGMLDQAIFQCSVKDYLKYIKQESDKAVKKDKSLPKATMWYLVNDLSQDKINTAKSLGCKGINATSASKSLISYAHNKNIKVCYYLVFSNSTAKRLQGYKIDFLMGNDLCSAMNKWKK